MRLRAVVSHMGLLPSRRESSWLDVGLLAVLAAAVGYYAVRFRDAGDVTPHLIRFYEFPRGTNPPAMMPQDKALLLLNDPAAGTAATGTAAPPLWSLLMIAGVIVLAVGPLRYWVREG